MEKKCKVTTTTTASRAGAGRTTAAAAKTSTTAAGKGSTVNTPRGNSRTPAVQTNNLAEAR